MISTKWFQQNNLDDILKIRTEVYCTEFNLSSDLISDEDDIFAHNVLLYEDNTPVGTGRLSYKSEKYIIDKLCVLKEHRNKNYEDLIIRMLVRKAINMGAEDVYTYIDDVHIELKLKNILEWTKNILKKR